MIESQFVDIEKRYVRRVPKSGYDLYMNVVEAPLPQEDIEISKSGYRRLAKDVSHPLFDSYRRERAGESILIRYQRSTWRSSHYIL